MKTTSVIALTALFLTVGACGRKSADSAPPTGPGTSETTSSAEAPPPPAMPPAHDQSFYDKAAEGGMAEVEAGTLAQSKAASAEVKSFGAMMVKDHTAANEKLKGIAAQNSVTLPADLSAEHQEMKATLTSLSGNEFDKAYIRGQIEDHEATAALLKTESESGQDADAKSFATETLPTVEAHLKKARALGQKLGVDKASAPR